ncbi:MAG: crossover junction endodeoxyribonuclease RuvC [Candidatus Pacebacteria bacterium]|nr:crossover junction endodeoxyribonuclease RuvC [Candidatus Paceibacterota bacterium]
MIILGIDPGYERVGIAIIEKPNTGKENLLYSNCFKTEAKLNFTERLFLIGQEIDRVCIKYTPTLLSIETLLFNSNQKTALKVSEARGVIIYEAKRHALDVYEYTPLQIKNAITGYGRATKNQVDMMTRQLVNIPETVKQDDEIDAIATALTCAASYKNEKFN